MTLEMLQIIWFLLIAVLIVGYTILDGFDLGVGMWYLFSRGEQARRTLVASIAPFWDGNEVWLLTAGGATFAAFPPVYAGVFSGFYLALMLVLVCLILRAVSLEFRAQESSEKARGGWDVAFALGSTVAALLFGVAFGNLLHGVPLNAAGDFTGNFFTLLNPFALVVGLLNVALLATHGAIYLTMKTGDELQASARRWGRNAWPVALVLAVVTVIWAAAHPHLLANYRALPVLWALPALGLAALLLTGVWHAAGKAARAFAASSVAIALLLGSGAAGLFPRMVPALGDLGNSLTLRDSSTQLTLMTMLVVAVVGIVFLAGYTTWVYKTFRGKAEAEEGY